MEYTNDVILSVRYRNNVDSSVNMKYNIMHKVINKIRNDNYFIFTMIISTLSLGIDYAIIIKFIEIVNLL